MKREIVKNVDGQLDIFEVIEDVEKNGLTPNPDPVIVKVGMGFHVMIDGKVMNETPYWSQTECHAFIDGLTRARNH